MSSAVIRFDDFMAPPSAETRAALPTRLDSEPPFHGSPDATNSGECPCAFRCTREISSSAPSGATAPVSGRSADPESSAGDVGSPSLGASGGCLISVYVMDY